MRAPRTTEERVSSPKFTDLYKLLLIENMLLIFAYYWKMKTTWIFSSICHGVPYVLPPHSAFLPSPSTAPRFPMTDSALLVLPSTPSLPPGWVPREFQAEWTEDRSKIPPWDKEFSCHPGFCLLPNLLNTKITDPVTRSFQEGACEECFQQITEGNPAPWALYPTPSNTHSLTDSMDCESSIPFLCLMVKKSRPRETVRNSLKHFKSCHKGTMLHWMLTRQTTCEGIQLATVVAPTAVSLEFKTPVSLIPSPCDGAGQQQESHLPGESMPHVQSHTARIRDLLLYFLLSKWMGGGGRFQGTNNARFNYPIISKMALAVL